MATHSMHEISPIGQLKSPSVDPFISSLPDFSTLSKLYTAQVGTSAAKEEDVFRNRACVSASPRLRIIASAPSSRDPGVDWFHPTVVSTRYLVESS